MKNEASPGRAPSLFLSPEGRGERLRNKFWVGRTAFPEILALKQESRILGQWSNSVSGSGLHGPKITESYQFHHCWYIVQITITVPPWKNHIQSFPSHHAERFFRLFLGSSPACGPLLQLATAQAGRGNPKTKHDEIS